MHCKECWHYGKQNDACYWMVYDESTPPISINTIIVCPRYGTKNPFYNQDEDTVRVRWFKNGKLK